MPFPETAEKGKLLSYLILLNIAIITTGVGLHEAGHLAFGSLLGCSGGKIILADASEGGQGPYTEMTCPGVDKAFLGLTGFPFPLLFALVFLLLGGYPEKNFGFLLLGLSLLLGSLDILLVMNSALLPPLLTTAGAALMMFGEYRLFSTSLSLARANGGRISREYPLISE